MHFHKLLRVYTKNCNKCKFYSCKFTILHIFLVNLNSSYNQYMLDLQQFFTGLTEKQ